MKYRTLRAAGVLLLGLALADAHAANCPPPPGVSPNARHSCPTRTQTQQVGEPVTNHPGGSPGRGWNTLPSSNQPGPGVQCQRELDGSCNCNPRAGTGRNIPCLPGTPSTADDTEVVFNYYYFNGINTPLGDGRQRGNYTWDARMIEGNLLDQGDRVGNPGKPQNGKSYGLSVRVGNETDVLHRIGHNFSGTDRRAQDAVGTFCAVASSAGDPQITNLARQLCTPAGDVAGWVDDLRGSGFLGMAGGDILECAMQAQGVKVHAPAKAGGNIEWTANLPEVKTIVSHIYQTLEAEKSQKTRPRKKNYFVIIGHSQGNFFAEGAGYLLHKQSPAVFENRVAILSFASPTSYDALDAGWRSRRMRYVTREDDAIVGLRGWQATQPLLKQKRPFEANAAALWPWHINAPQDIAVALLLKPPPQCSCPSPNDALYMPGMNSHLLDNYLTDPTLTEPGHQINAVAALNMKVKVSPPTRAVLGQARNYLRQLKTSLVNGP